MINIIYQTGIPEPDSMPAVFTTYYLPKSGCVDILAQLRAAYIPGFGLWLDITKFEREPDYNGSLNGSSCSAFSIAGNNVLTAVTLSEGNILLFTDGKQTGEITPLSRYKGEDEQGWYFGVRFIISDDIISSAGMSVPLSPDIKPDAGFFTFQEAGNRPHFGGSEPVFSDSPFNRANLAPSGFLIF